MLHTFWQRITDRAVPWRDDLARVDVRRGDDGAADAVTWQVHLPRALHAELCAIAQRHDLDPTEVLRRGVRLGLVAAAIADRGTEDDALLVRSSSGVHEIAFLEDGVAFDEDETPTTEAGEAGADPSTRSALR
jgi:hypothetical protein